MGILEVIDMGKTLITALKLTRQIPDGSEPGSIGYLVQINADEHPDKLALMCEETSLSWGEFNQRANQVAHFLQQKDIQRGDVVTLMMENRLEFMIFLAGISKLGAIAGLINTNLRDQGLVHCIEIIQSKKCVIGEECLDSVAEISNQLELKSGEDFVFVEDKRLASCPNWAEDYQVFSDKQSTENLPITATLPMSDKGTYIFTSGTTGLPKAAVISGKRFYRNSILAARLLVKADSDMRLYNCLPLYHSTGLMIGFGAVLVTGSAMFIRRKFSASNFLLEVRKYQTNAFVYIGELCRYLLTTPAFDDDADNPLHTAFGNGLRPDIWMQFKQRFGIQRIGELYGASEGNAGFFNILNKDKTVGMTTLPLKIVEYDVLSDTVLLDEKGYCKEVPRGESGLLLFEITEETPFEGYTNKNATEEKILRNVVKPGDAYFNTGDLIRVVDVGFAFGLPHYQFSDRVGDTFRWKGENVATNEVGEVINHYPGVMTTNVYGVEIPGTDGRAGMAAITFTNGIDSASQIDLKALSGHICDSLPGYARPVFVRILKDMDSTSTFKMIKGRLRQEEYHPEKCKDDDVLVLKPGSLEYQVLDEEFYQQIMQAKAAY